MVTPYDMRAAGMRSRKNSRLTVRRAAFGAAASFIVLTVMADLANAAERGEKPGELQLYEENDLFYYGAPKEQRTDQWYTQGLRVERTYDSNKDQQFIGSVPSDFWCAWLCGSDHRFGYTNAGWAFGQSIYTPQDISIAEPQPEDRPWAGYLYFSRLAKKSYRVPAWRAERQDRFEISVGVIGPLALGEQAQNFIHDLKGIGGGMGWDHQLDNEPTLLLRYDAMLRFPACARYFDVQPYGRVFFGTVLTAADMGAAVRVGYNLSGFVPGGIAPSLAFAQATTSDTPEVIALRQPCEPPTERRGFLSSAALFGRVQARAVARNIFIDGNTFGEGTGLNKRTLVYEAAAGIDIALFRGWGLAFQLITRTEEFEGPEGSPGSHRFGAIMFHRVD